MTLLRGFLSQRTDDFERIIDVGYKLPMSTRVTIRMEFFVRSMPVDQRILYLNWLGERQLARRRRREYSYCSGSHPWPHPAAPNKLICMPQDGNELPSLPKS